MRPRVTLFVLAYRQEAEVAEAIAGAFAQTGDAAGAPIEILLSDDCSPDGTYQVMQAMAAAYAGPHTVILNRNPRNLGITAHVDRIMDLTNVDVIDLGAIDADSLTAGDQAFHEVRAFTHHAGEMTIRYNANSGLTVIKLDVNGDGTTDAQISIQGDHHGFDNFVL